MLIWIHDNYAWIDHNLNIHPQLSIIRSCRSSSVFSYFLLRFGGFFSFPYHAYFSYETSNDLCAQIVFHRYHIEKAFQVCVLREYADLENVGHGN